MITVEQNNNLVTVAVFGEFTLADYKEFEDMVRYRLKFEEKVNLLLDLRDMVGFTLDVAWEEIKFSREHATDFEKIAVVTDDQWLTWSAWLSRMFVDAEIGVFGDYDEAAAWVAA
ncbi:MAG: STAS/SEC14 domain-containing protein [Pseudomonadota bacterium]|jgi:hypothetical protein